MDPTKKELYEAKRSSGLDAGCSEIQPLIDKLRSDTDDTNWIVFKINGKEVGIHNSGSDGLEEFISSIDDDDIYYGVVRCNVAGMVKFYHVFFVGVNVGAMKRGKASLHKAAVFGLVDAHGEISCNTGLEEFTSEFILGEISKLSKSTDILF